MKTLLRTHIIEESKVKESLLFLIVGTSAGIIFYYISELSLIYIILFGIGLFIICTFVIFKKVKNILLGILTITIPININKYLFFNESHTGGVEGLVISVWFIILVSLYIIWLIEILSGNASKINFFPRLSIPLILLLLISILSIIKATDIQLSLFQIFQRIKVYLLFFYIINNCNTFKYYRFILSILFVTLFCEVCLGLYQHYANTYIDLGILTDSHTSKPREFGDLSIMGVSGTMDSDDRFASYLIMMLPLLLSTIISKQKLITKISYLPLLICGVILLIYTFSRGGWLGFGIGMLLFSTLKIVLSNKNFKKYFQIIFILVFVFTLIYQFKDVILLRVLSNDHGSAYSRIPMMLIALEMIKANPLLGVGINNYVTVMISYDYTGLASVFFHPVHNVYLQLAAEIGIIGLLTFFWFIVMLYREVAVSLKKCIEFFQNQMIGLISGITGLLVHLTVNNATIETEPFILFWLFAALTVAISDKRFKTEEWA